MNSSSFYNSSSLRPLSVENRTATLCLKLSPWFMIGREILVLPLSVLILYLAHQQRRRPQRSRTTRHANVIVFHQATTELFWPFATAFCLWGEFVEQDGILTAAYFLGSLTLYGQSLFHLLAGMERYLAVVYPITYRGLKSERGARIRDVSIGCTWLLCVILSGVATLPLSPGTLILNLTLVSLIDVGISFLSLSVVCLLIRQGPGRKTTKVVDVRKRKALSTIMVILGMLWVWFAGYLVGMSLVSLQALNHRQNCQLRHYIYVFNLPCSMFLPLLYLYRTGKLKWCQCKRR